MCGRFAFYSPSDAITHAFDLKDVPAIEPRYNIAPTQYVAVIRQTPDRPKGIAMLKWGLIPSWAKDPTIGNKLINARGETVHAKPSFRRAFAKRRCLVLVDGYYEWRAEKGGKQPYFIAMKNAAPFALAGLWESWQDPRSEVPLETCTIVTTEPHPRLAHLHSRMPVIVPRDGHAAWLDPANTDVLSLRKQLTSFDGDQMTFRPVTRAVGNARNEGAWLLKNDAPGDSD